MKQEVRKSNTEQQWSHLLSTNEGNQSFFGGMADSAITGTRKAKAIDGTILLIKKVHTHTKEMIRACQNCTDASIKGLNVGQFDCQFDLINFNMLTKMTVYQYKWNIN